MSSKYLRIALPVPLRRLFDYLPPTAIDPATLTPGVRIQVPFQSRKLIGILIEVTSESTVTTSKLKRALEIIDTQPILTPDIYRLCQWAATYYHYALGEVLIHAMPALLRKGKVMSFETEARGEEPVSFSDRATHGCVARSQGAASSEKITGSSPRASADPLTSCASENINALPHALNTAQHSAVTTINQTPAATFRVFLLDGITGSGKTEVYLRVIAETLTHNKQTLVLVPEISLTPQTIERFRARFPNHKIVALHSSLTDKERLQTWSAAKTGAAQIIIGTRSAIFTPCRNLGMIIVDEEHDPSFKQQDRFRYHARDLAVMRAQINKIPIILGSATPSLETLLNVQRKRYDYLSLPLRAGNAQLPTYQIIDTSKSASKTNTNKEGLSETLLNTMREHLAQQQQVMLFLNRRGFAPILYCNACSWIAKCKRCDARMVYHAKSPRRPARLHCHHCDARTDIPQHCAQCSATTLQPIGIGTQRLEQTLMQHFPNVPIIRVDRDNTQRKGAMQELLDQVQQQPQAILIGTQMLAKGHHFPQVTLVGIIDADNGLFSADFRAAEQLGQLLLQVAGRAGRADKPGTVLIQTRHPNHPLWQTLLTQGYQPFAQSLLAEREQALLPPYAYFAIFRAEAYAEITASDFLAEIKKICATVSEAVTILGPVPALLAKRKSLYCQQLLVKAHTRPALQQFLQTLLLKLEKLPMMASVKWTLDVDPVMF